MSCVIMPCRNFSVSSPSKQMIDTASFTQHTKLGLGEADIVAVSGADAADTGAEDEKDRADCENCEAAEADRGRLLLTLMTLVE